MSVAQALARKRGYLSLVERTPEANRAAGGDPQARRRCPSVGGAAVRDRIAQTVVAQELEKIVEPIFDDDSYGHRLI